MKRLTFTLGLFCATLTMHGQGGGAISLKITSSSEMPYFISQWYGDTVKLHAIIANSSSNTLRTLLMWQIVRNSEGVYKDVWSSATPTDTFIVPPYSTQRTHFRDLLEYENSSFDPVFYDNYVQFGKLQPGNYKAILRLQDTNDNVVAIDSVTFSVNDHIPPAPVYPYCNAKVFHKHKKRIIFGWVNSDAYRITNPTYNLRIWKKDSNCISSDIEASVPALLVNLPNTFFYRVTNPTIFFDTGKIYYWQVQTLENGQPYGQHGGWSNLSSFEVSTEAIDSAGDFYRLYGPWSDTSGTPVNPPDPGICELFSNIENVGHYNGWGFKTGTVLLRNRDNTFNSFRPPNNGFDNNFFKLRDKGIIAELGISVPSDDPNNRHGTFVMQIGNYTSSKASASMFRTFTVTNSMTKLTFWRCVATAPDNDPHPFKEKAIGLIRLITGDYMGGSYNCIEPRVYHADNKICGSNHLGYSVHYWRCESFNLVPFRGQQITIDLTTATCAEANPFNPNLAGNHKAVMYVDFCAPEGPIPIISNVKTSYCKGDNIFAFGDSSVYETESYWELAESKDGLMYNTLLSNYSYKGCNRLVHNPDFFDVNLALNNQFKCNYFYRIRLIALSGCSRDTAFKIFKYNCVDTPNIGGPYCCNNWNCTILVGSISKPGQTYQWGPPQLIPCFGNANSSQTTLSFGPSAPCQVTGPWLDLTLTTTDQNGCTIKTGARVSSQPLNFYIKVDTLECGLKVSSSVPDSWKAAQTWTLPSGSEHIEGGYKIPIPLVSSTRVRLKVDNGCGWSTLDTFLGPWTRMTGPVDTIMWNTVWLSGNDFEVRYENEPNHESRYNAYRWQIEWVDRWGGYRKKEGYNIKGFTNGTMRLPAADRNSFNLDMGTPVAIKLQNCNNGLGNHPYFRWVPACHDHASGTRRVMRHFRKHENSIPGEPMGFSGPWDTCFQLKIPGACGAGTQYWKDLGSGRKQLRIFDFWTKIPICEHKVIAYGHTNMPAYFHYNDPWTMIHRFD